jgi:hypothetical protein
MAYYSGRTGRIMFGPYPNWGNDDPNWAGNEMILKLRDWSLETTVELLETTTVDTAVKSYTPGVMAATGSATMLYYRREGTTSTEPGTQFDQVLSRIMKTTTAGVTANDRVLLGLRVGNTGAGADIKDDISFKAWITSASMQVATGELSAISFNFTVDGQFLEIPEA